MKIKFTKLSSTSKEKDSDIRIEVKIKPISFDTTGFERNPSLVGLVNIKSIIFLDYKSKYKSNKLDTLLDSNLNEFELDFDKDRTDFWVIRGHESNTYDRNKLSIDLHTGSGELVIGQGNGFKPEIATLTAVREEPEKPAVTRIEIKHCNQCSKETTHIELNNQQEESCVRCNWKSSEDTTEKWEKLIKKEGFEKAKKKWKEKSEDEFFNKDIKPKLTDEEKAEWNEVVERINKLFNPSQENEKPFNYLPLLIGGGIIVVGIALILMFVAKPKRRRY